MKNNKLLKAISITLLSSLLLSGCAGKEEVPVLLDSVIDNQSFRPVTRGNIGTIDVSIANIVGEEICYFNKNAMTISEICVDFGDYVNEGDVLVKIDTKESNNEISMLNKKKTYLDKINEIKKQLCEKELAMLNLEHETVVAADDKKAISDCEKEIEKLNEELVFNEALHSHDIRVINDRISEINELISDGTIKAKKSGYVTYIKDLSKTNVAASLENIVIVSDYDNLHIEIDNDISSQYYKNTVKEADNIYVVIDGKNVDLSLKEYSNAELAAAQSSGKYPKVSFNLPDNTTSLVVGNKIPVWFMQDGKNDVLTIGLDSLYTENDENYVYVQSGDKKEKRIVEVGVKNKTDVEIISGLTEGEWVYYSTDSMIPADYEEYQVASKVYGEDDTGTTLDGYISYTSVRGFYQNKNAVVEAVNFKSGDEVKKGDLICILDLEEKTASMKEKKQEIENLLTDYQNNLDSNARKLEKLDKDIEKVHNNVIMYEALIKEQEDKLSSDDPKAGGSEESLGEFQGNWIENYYSEQNMQLEKEIILLDNQLLDETYNYEKTVAQNEYNKMAEINNANGKRNVYADCDGILGTMNIYPDKKIDGEKDPLLFYICDESGKKITVNAFDNFVASGNECRFSIGGDKTNMYTEKVIGNSGVSAKSYISVINDKLYVTTSEVNPKGNLFYMDIPDELEDNNLKNIKVVFSNAYIPNMLTVPNEYIQSENSKVKANDILYYVWKKQDGKIIKQYVTINETLHNNSDTCVLTGLNDGDIVVKRLKER